jgi:GAF domain-containing protein
MPPQEPLARSLSALSRFFVGDGTLQDTLHRVTKHAEEAVPAAAMTGITMLVEGRATTAVLTDENAAEIDTAQYETGIGPCLDSFREAKIYRIDDTAKDDRWRPFSEAAAAHEGLGALNFYARTPKGFSEDDEDVAAQFAVQAAVVLANAQAYWDAHQLNENLSTAMQSRAVIEQAKGILMGAQGCSADEAFQILVRVSQRENRKLREIAEELVSRAQQAGSDRRPRR